MTIRRYSSRGEPLDKTVLLEHLKGARSYKRIAGYFTSSLFEVTGELLDDIPDVKIVCNADIHPEDLKIAKLRDARMIGRWNEHAPEAEALLNRERYIRLDAFLQKHGQAIRVAPDEICGFLHGKAGVIECRDGRKLGFIGSMNETGSGWRRNYEIVWEDTSPEGIAWIEEEFNFLWKDARELPRAVIQEVRRRGHRREITFDEIREPEEIAPAALIESPLYREGYSLQPWQQNFLTECLRHYNNHGIVRLLLADEVGLGKTLSLGTAALALCLLQDRNGGKRKPVVIFAPATLCEQWQTEMIDKLGIPCARWETRKKVWVDHDEQEISAAGHEQITRCPRRIGIISTGLMMRDSTEKANLLDLRFALVILDEAHKARSQQGFGPDAGFPNELLAFANAIAERSDHVLLGTATPIQTRSEDLWDLMRILQGGKGRFVFGNEYSGWNRPDDILPLISGKTDVDPDSGWDLLRSPLPLVNSTDEPKARKLFSAIRHDLGLNGVNERKTDTSKPITDLKRDTREVLEESLEKEISGSKFFQRENPFVRHIVLRKRSELEKLGLLSEISVNLHPDRKFIQNTQQFDALFEGKALRTNDDFREAYEEAQAFGKALSKRGKGGGFMKDLMAQRICSSIASGLISAQKLLSGDTLEEETDEQVTGITVESPEEKAMLERLIDRLENINGDPKFDAVIHFLDKENWLKHGVIIFSRYFDTAKWIADFLAKHYSSSTIGLYAGASRSRLYQGGESVGTGRETLKKMVAEHEMKIMVATDAACEGLNLQTLGTLINIDLWWNPVRLEQRLGRIKRFGQTRDKVDVLNLVYEQTVDEKVYKCLSRRARFSFELFGSLPDTIKAEWIDEIETMGEKMDEVIEVQRKANGFDLRYNSAVEPSGRDWRDCTDVLSRRDFAQLMRNGWR